MSKQTESNLFILPSFSRAAEFYQHLLRGIVNYEELGNRILRSIEAAYAFRQVERVAELSQILISIPVTEYRLIGQYYFVWCQFREIRCNDRILERVIEQTETYKSKALISRGTFDLYRNKPETAIRFYTEALRVSSTASDYIEAARGIAHAKSVEGFHASALKDLERLLPLLSYAGPLNYFEVINSFAVELLANNRLSEAENATVVAASSALGPFYPEWQETLSDVRSRRKRRSTVAFSRAQIEQEYDAAIEAPRNVIDRARVRAVIDYMKANLNRSITRGELAKAVGLSTPYFSQLFKIETGIPLGEYLIRLRMEKAGQLLATTFMSIKQIMADVGYYNKANFGRSFKKRFDVTPSEYRRRALTSGV